MTISQILTILECERDLYAALSEHSKKVAQVGHECVELRRFELGQQFAYRSIADSLTALLERIVDELPQDG